jgi:hypothetical protein
MRRAPSLVTLAVAAATAMAFTPAGDRPTPDERPERPAQDAGEQANDRAAFLRGADDDGGGDTTADPRVTIAVIDAPTNPYHEFFHEGSEIYADAAPSAVTPEVLDELGITDEHIIRLTRTGDFDEDFAHDREQFEAIERGQPYWFEGTNVIGVSFESEDGERFRVDDDSNSAHGVGTTASALRANPEAIVISVEGIGGSGSDDLEDAEIWSFTHPAVDLVSTSYGTPAGEPDVLGGFGNLTGSYEGVVENGKHHFGAVANTPVPAPIDPTGGPWWTIGVSGYEEGGSEGRQMLSGQYADVVGDFTQTLPYCLACQEGESTVGGTSFATPTTAGVFSDALLQARAAAGHAGGIVTEGVERPLMVAGGGLELTNWELRRALEEAAVFPSAADWDPSADPPFGLATTPAIDAAPHLTFGWGAVTPDEDHGVVAELLAHAGVEGEPTRTKGEDACSWMTLNIEVRRIYWDDVEPGSDSAGADDHPYEYC